MRGSWGSVWAAEVRATVSCQLGHAPRSRRSSRFPNSQPSATLRCVVAGSVPAPRATRRSSQQRRERENSPTETRTVPRARAIMQDGTDSRSEEVQRRCARCPRQTRLLSLPVLPPSSLNPPPRPLRSLLPRVRRVAACLVCCLRRRRCCSRSPHGDGEDGEARS